MIIHYRKVEILNILDVDQEYQQSWYAHVALSYHTEYTTTDVERSATLDVRESDGILT